MSERKLDKLTRAFLTGSSNPLTRFDPFADLQDPTFMSFRINFFPDLGIGALDDLYSSNGLFRPDGWSTRFEYAYGDSAQEYLRNIGSPVRQHYHRAFTNMLWNLQEKAPWYFQSIQGLGDLYVFDMAQNFRAKDKVLTIECLESIDMRVSYMADLYRNFAFDLKNMREILPVNLRTFNMEIHVLEFRRFNTTFGVIADALSDRPFTGEDRQKAASSTRKRVYSPPVLGQGLFNNFVGIGQDIASLFGGIGGLFGSSSFPLAEIESAFEAVTVHTFRLKECEFDFNSETMPYLDSVSVKDNSTEATAKFKIKVGQIQKVSSYPFFNFIIAEHISNTFLNPEYVKNLDIPGQNTPLQDGARYIEPNEIRTIVENFFPGLRESIYPTGNIGQGTDYKKADYAVYREYKRDSDYLKIKPLERLLGGVLRNATNIVNAKINESLGEMTDGLIGTAPLGNVFGKPALVDRVRQGIRNFGLNLGSENQNSNETQENSSTSLGNIYDPSRSGRAPRSSDVEQVSDKPKNLDPYDILPNPAKKPNMKPYDIIPPIKPSDSQSLSSQVSD